MISVIAGLILRIGPTLRPSSAMKLAKVALVVLGLLIAFVLYQVWKSAVVEDHDKDVAIEVERGGRKADQAIENKRRAREQAERQARQEFDRETETLPDEPLTVRQRIDICRELQQGGVDTSLLAECDGL